MPRKDIDILYSCPCCGYKTKHKTNIKNHLYKLKKPCPKLYDDVDLTEDIKEYILKNRVYKPPAIVPSIVANTITTNINQYNIINNFINGIDVTEKLKKYLQYRHIDMIPFTQKVDDMYQTTAKRLISNTRNVELKFQDILDLISDVCNGECKVVEEFNVVYDSKVDTIKLFDDGVWQEMFVNKGINHIIKTIQEYYLDAYELYLIRKIYDKVVPMRQRSYYKELLVEYFKLIGSFDIDPCFKDRNNNKILYNDSDPRYDIEIADHDIDGNMIADSLWKTFSETRDAITKSELTNTKKSIIEIIKKNTKRSIEELNKKIMEADDIFITSLMG